MTVSEIINIQLLRRVRYLKKSISILAADGAPEAMLTRLYRQLDRTKKRHLSYSADYEHEFPGLLAQEILSWTELRGQYKKIRFKTAGAVYIFLPVSGKLMCTQPDTGAEKHTRHSAAYGSGEFQNIQGI